MFGNAARIGRIAGIDIRVHATWVFIALLIGWTFYARFQFLYDELATGETVALAAAGVVIFFGSILLHELSHSLMAKARGITVRSITLFLFGGATDADVQSRGPGAEFAVTIVGPLTSVVVGGVLWAASAAVPGDGGPLTGMLGYLAWINVALAVFNLLPGFPLDGGRILRALLWRSTGDLERATNVAATSGRIVGYGLVALGLFLFVATGRGGLWLALIGWFLAQAATAEARQQHGDTTPVRR